MKYAGAYAQHGLPTVDGVATTSTQRQGLHLIYLLHDLLHHANFHVSNKQQQTNLSDALSAAIPAIFRSAARDQKPRVCKRLQSVVQIWAIEHLLETQQLSELRRVIADPSSNASSESPGEKDGGIRETREPPYLMPSSHGDPSLPYHELPAGNLMPHIIPNRTVAMRPEDIRPLQFKAGPADEPLIDVVRTFLKEVEMIANPYEQLDEEGIVPDVDDLGQLVYRNEDGETVSDTYYGWSRSFCDKMRNQRHGASDNPVRGRSRSYSSSRSRSPHKRRRFSGSSRTSSPHMSRNLSPAPVSPPSFQTQYSTRGTYPESRQGGAFVKPIEPAAIPPSLPVPPLGPGGLPLPPPRPPNWNGPWPPPPHPPFSGRAPPPFGR